MVGVAVVLVDRSGWELFLQQYNSFSSIKMWGQVFSCINLRLAPYRVRTRDPFLKQSLLFPFFSLYPPFFLSHPMSLLNYLLPSFSHLWLMSMTQERRVGSRVATYSN